MDINSIVTNVKRVLAPFGIGKTQVPNNDIPYKKTTVENQMSWYDGIPTITTEPVREDGTGGIPPRAGDIAGLHNVWSTTQFNAQLGIMPNEYNSAYQDSEYFKGYPRGAVVLWPAGDSTTKNIYISLIDNNTYLPNNTQYWRQMIDGNAFANINLTNVPYTPYYSDSIERTGVDFVVRWWSRNDGQLAWRLWRSGYCEIEGRTWGITNTNSINITLPFPIQRGGCNCQATPERSRTDNDWDMGGVGLRLISNTVAQMSFSRIPENPAYYYWRVTGEIQR